MLINDLMKLLKPNETLSRFTSTLYICHNKAMTGLVEYGTMCLYQVYRRTRGAAALPGLKNFWANSVFRASSSCSKILNDKKYLNTVKIFGTTLFFRASASCWKILNDKKCCIFNTVKNFRANSVFRASASCSKILNDKKYFNTAGFFKENVRFLVWICKDPISLILGPHFLRF